MAEPATDDLAAGVGGLANPFAPEETEDAWQFPPGRGVGAGAEGAERASACSARRVLKVASVGSALFAVVAVTFLTRQLVQKRSSGAVLLTAGAACVACVTVSLIEILQHKCAWNQPLKQRMCVRILLMPPIYSVAAFAGLLLTLEATSVLTAVRESYEAVALWSFTYLMLSELDDVACARGFSAPQLLVVSAEPVAHLWPLHRLQPWPAGEGFIRRVEAGVISYALLRPVSAVTALIASRFGLYQSGNLSVRNLYPYLALLNATVQCAAIYSLVMLYRATHTLLSGCNPLAKFVCIKAVVFFTFWQGIAIALTIRIGVLQRIISPPEGDDSEALLATRLQNFLICMEMLIAALAHTFAFSAAQYAATSPHEGYGGEADADASSSRGCLDALSLRDFANAVRGRTGHRPTRPKHELRAGVDDEDDVLLARLHALAHPDA